MVSLASVKRVFSLTQFNVDRSTPNLEHATHNLCPQCQIEYDLAKSAEDRMGARALILIGGLLAAGIVIHLL
jgi:hypothetical protein